MENRIEVRHLNKYFRRKKVIDRLSFECRAGEVFGLLGPNGAGKTLTVRLLLGLCTPDSGEIRLDGAELTTDPARALRHTGGFADTPEFYGFLTARQNLRQLSRMRGKADEARIGEVLDLCGLTQWANQKVRRYSLAQRQKLGVAQALLCRPDILILDEPANGLDPVGVRDLRDLVKRLAHREQICIFLTSHVMSEVEILCDRVGILDRGRLVQVKDLKELQGGMPSSGRTAFRFVVSPLPAAKKLVEKLGTGTLLDTAEDHMDIQLAPGELIELNRAFIENGISLHTVSPVRGGSLEDMFLTPPEEEGGGPDV